MTIRPSIGEQLVGSYLKIIEECEIVSYNQRSMEDGDQMELDVLGVRAENGEQTVIACEVITHLRGLLYTGSPSSNRWNDYGNKNYQRTLERIWEKFCTDYEYVIDVFDDADAYTFQLWSPYVPKGHRTRGLEKLQGDFEQEFDSRIECLINERYTERMEKLRAEATTTQKDYGETGFRFLQIMEQLR